MHWPAVKLQLLTSSSFGSERDNLSRALQKFETDRSFTRYVLLHFRDIGFSINNLYDIETFATTLHQSVFYRSSISRIIRILIQALEDYENQSPRDSTSDREAFEEAGVERELDLSMGELESEQHEGEQHEGEQYEGEQHESEQYEREDNNSELAELDEFALNVESGNESANRTMTDSELEQQLNRLKEKYFLYIQNSTINENINQDVRNLSVHWDQLETLIQNKTGLQRTLDPPTLREYLYFGTIPSWVNRRDPPENGDTVELGGNTYKYEYFMWRKEGDTDAERLSDDINLTWDIIDTHRQNSVQKWNKRQVTTYINTNVIPEFLDILDIHVNYDRYQWIVWDQSAYMLTMIMNLYLYKQDILFDETFIEKLRETKPSKQKYFRFNTRAYMSSRFDMRYMKALETMVVIIQNIKYIAELMGKDLWRKLKDLAKEQSDTRRFKWQKLCSPSGLGDKLSTDELRELAALERVPFFAFMTKRELCAELSKRFQNVIEGKPKVESKCINTTSIMMTDIKDIPPEFFYAYQHNNKIYCDDIRDLYKHFKIQGARHPVDRTPVSQNIVTNVMEMYKTLEYTTRSMEDFFTEPEPIMSQSSLLSAKVAELAAHLNYPNSLENFKKAELSKVTEFVDALIRESLMTSNERSQLSILRDPVTYKMTLIQMLISKIQNDPAVITLTDNSTLSTVAINVSNVYNEFF
jgi:hypothetical protein